MRFSKMHGAGNDFVVIDLRDGQPPPTARQCRWLGDRHRGVGCDQILTIEPSRTEQAIAAYRIWNADGSASGQCGNGARCVAAWLLRDGAGSAAGFVLDSPSGQHAVDVIDPATFRVAMGVPDFAPASLPLRGFAHAQPHYELSLDGETVMFGAVSMGNPHAVLEVDDAAAAPLHRIAHALQTHTAFPQSVNVGVAQVLSPTHIRMRVYERGVGETLACGSGACAAAAVLMQRGHIAREALVSLPGGDLRIEWPDTAGPVFLQGSAAFVYEGEVAAAVWNEADARPIKADT